MTTAKKSSNTRKLSNNTLSKTRRVSKGDVPPENSAQGIEEFSVNAEISAARESKSAALQDIINRMSAGKELASLPEALRAILDGASPDDAAALSKAIANMPSIESTRSVPTQMTNSPQTGVMAATLTKTYSRAAVTKSKNIIFKLNY